MTKEALAQPEHCSDCGQKLGDANHIHTCSPQLKPVAWAMLHDNGHFIDAIHPDEHARVEGEYTHPLYTTPTQRTWVGLMDEERKSFWTADQMTQEEWDELFSAIEAKLKEKNT